MTKMILSENGYTVLEASNGKEALAVAERHREPIHLLMTDLIMPHVRGRELAERRTAARSGLRVLFMSGYTEDVVVQQGVASATADFLAKPFSLAALTNKVREVLDSACRGRERQRDVPDGELGPHVRDVSGRDRPGTGASVCRPPSS